MSVGRASTTLSFVVVTLLITWLVWHPEPILSECHLQNVSCSGVRLCLQPVLYGRGPPGHDLILGHKNVKWLYAMTLYYLLRISPLRAHIHIYIRLDYTCLSSAKNNNNNRKAGKLKANFRLMMILSKIQFSLRDPVKSMKTRSLEWICQWEWSTFCFHSLADSFWIPPSK